MKANNKKILGLDPGFGRIGYAVIDSDAAGVKLVSCGCYETDKKLALALRLNELRNFIKQLLVASKPQVVAMEKLFFAANTKTAIEVSEARGVMLAEVAGHNLELLELTPPQIKLAVTGDGRADKKQIQKMLKLVLKLDHDIKSDDAADAVGVALAASFSLPPKGN